MGLHTINHANEYQLIKEIKSIANGHFDTVLFVSLEGDNSDGLTWDTAYTSLALALADVPSGVNYGSVIYVAPGTYDVNVSGSLSINKQVIIQGISPLVTTFKNTHASATAVFSLDAKCRLAYLTVWCAGTVDTGGVIINETSGLQYVTIVAATTTVEIICISITTGVGSVILSNVSMIGNTTNTIGLKAVGDGGHQITDIKAVHCAVGIWFAHADEGRSTVNGYISDLCTLAVKVIIGADYIKWMYIYFFNNTTNVEDNGASTVMWKTVFQDHEHEAIYPEDPAAGITITADALASTWGVWTQLTAGFSEFVRIVGAIASELVADNKYLIEFSYGAAGGDHIVAQELFGEGSAKQTINLAVDTGYVPPNTPMWARVQSESGGSDTCDIWLKYFTVND